MTVGESIKIHRNKAGLTQKDLADNLCVSFQTVSKWENNTNEPDLSTLKSMCSIFNCSLDELVDYQEPQTKVEETIEETAQVEAVEVPDEVVVCEPKIEEKNEIAEIKPTPVETKNSTSDLKLVYEDDDKPVKKKKKAPGANVFKKIVSRDDKKPLIWAIVLGVVALVATLVVCIVNYDNVGIGWTIGAPILAGYCLAADIYCIFTDSFVSEVFCGVAGFSIKFPGLIFTWDLDGFLWLIAMKILFAIIGICVGIATFFLAVGLATFLAVFAFIPLLIYNTHHYDA